MIMYCVPAFVLMMRNSCCPWKSPGPPSSHSENNLILGAQIVNRSKEKKRKKRKQTKITPDLINRTVPGLSVWMNVKSVSSSAKTASAA